MTKHLSVKVDDAIYSELKATAEARDAELSDIVRERLAGANPKGPSAVETLGQPAAQRPPVPYIAEELETADHLLRIARDPEGLPVGFVRAKSGDAWQPVNFRRLADINEEVQGLKRDKLAEEVKRIRVQRVAVENRLPVGVRAQYDAENANAPEILYCSNCRRLVDTFGMEESCRAAGHTFRAPTASERYAVRRP